MSGESEDFEPEGQEFSPLGLLLHSEMLGIDWYPPLLRSKFAQTRSIANFSNCCHQHSCCQEWSRFMNMWFLPTSCSFQGPCEHVNYLIVSLDEDRNLVVMKYVRGVYVF